MQACQCAAGYSFVGNQSLAICSACPNGTYKLEVSNSEVCSICALGTYATGLGSSVCTGCPAFSYTTAPQSSSILSCKCLAGFVGPSGGPCLACGDGTYSTSLGASACLQCSAGKYFSPPNISIVVSVVEYCQVCPASSWSNMGSVSIQNCSCNSGFIQLYDSDGYRSCIACRPGFYSLTGDQYCSLCPVAKYSNFMGASSCTFCPIHQTTAANGSSDVSSCVCKCGYYAASSDTNGKQCVSCPSGQYKDVIGDDVEDCLRCPSGFFSDTVGACSCPKQCPANSNSDVLAAFSFCSCNAGFGAIEISDINNFTCFPCPPGSYRLGSDTNQYCTPCLAGYYNKRFLQTACYLCPVGKSTLLQGSDNESSCLCDRGFFCLNETCSICKPCPAGSYKSTIGQQNCTECDFPDLTIDSVGQISSEICGTPDVPSVGAATGGTVVAIPTCPPGQQITFLVSTTCQLCPEGTYKPMRSDTYYDSFPCICCPANTYQPQVGQVSAASCLVCPQGSTNAGTACGRSIADCLCNPGSYNVDFFPWCVQCQPGLYASGLGSTLCELCSAGTYQSAFASTSCTPCPTGRGTWELVNGQELQVSGASKVDACKCDSGYMSNGLECLDCQPGSYRLNPYSFACLLCGVGKYSTAHAAVSNSTCLPCYQGTTTLKEGANNSVLCVCLPGWYQSQSGYCLQCTPGTYKSATGSHACIPCEKGKYQEYPGSISCTGCFLFSFSPVLGNSDKSDCYCNAGYEYRNGECVGCDFGKYKSSSSNLEPCAQCPHGTYTVYTNSTMVENCINCPNFTTSLDLVDPDTGQLRGQSCVCLEGFYSVNLNCFPCPPGTFKDFIGNSFCTPCGSDFYNPQNGSTSASQCQPCMDGTWTEGKVVNSAESSCTCLPGFFAQPDGLMCAPCQAGKYKTTSGPGPCISCPLGTYSFTKQAGITACASCPSNSATLNIGQASKTACLCAAGYFGWNGGPCFPCDVGYYKLSVGSDFCSPCPEGTFGSLPGSTSVYDCYACSNHTTTLIGQSSSARCLCSPGYTLAANFPSNNNSGCVACPAGKFKNYVGDDQCNDCLSGVYSTNLGMSEDFCTLCPANSITYGQGHNSSSYCKCQSGYWNTNSFGTIVHCELCPYGKFFSEVANLCISCPPEKYWYYNG